MDGMSKWLPFEITLNEFNIQTYSNGVPSMYEARVTIDTENVVLKVNQPYNISFGKDLYLVGFDSMHNGDSCILQVVNEPWRYAALAGVIMMLAGAFLLFVGGPRRRNDED